MKSNFTAGKVLSG